MMRCASAIVIALLLAGSCRGQVTAPVIKASLLVDEAPTWAVLERELFARMSDAADVFLEKYVNADGRFKYDTWGKLDDSYEPFHNWPTLYVLGGDEKLLKIAQRQFEVITERFTEVGVVADGFRERDDWFHMGEGYHLFYMLCLADPANPANVARAERFAGFYLNDGDVRNYDPQRNIILAPRNGSGGPAPWSPDGAGDYVWTSEHYGLPFYDVPGVEDYSDLKDPDNMKKMAEACHVRWTRGDVPANLAATSLVLNAYLCTGGQKYADWVKRYVDGWVRRTEENDGILPDNIGLIGKTGEYMGGKWWGGLYGWTCYHGWGNLAQAVGMAAENAVLVTGDLEYVKLPRSQIDLLTRLAIAKGNTLYAPSKHGDPGKVVNKPLSWLPVIRKPDGAAREINGWFKFEPMDPVGPAHLWSLSMDPEDMARAEKLRQRDPKARWPRDWERILPINRFASKDHGGHEAAWMAYLAGEYERFPVELLTYNLSQVETRVAEIQRHNPEEGARFSLIYRNPITAEGLVNLTMGGPLPFYNGGLLMTRVRYFDPQRKLPGLPADVAALVKRLEADRTVLELINLSETHARDVVVQAGAYGEHRFTTVARTVAGENGRPAIEEQAIDASRIRLHLPPRTRIVLDAGTRRFVNKPTYALP
jgi:hypothetical protein